MKIVIDTNVFISSFFGGIPREIINLWKNDKLTLCLTQPIIEEYIRVLKRMGLDDKKEIDRLIKLFAEGFNTKFISKTPKMNIVIDDPDDDKFIECAVALDCKYIISGHKHLRKIKKYFDNKILSPREFMDRFEI